ncbi:MAG: pyruvate dehydrogenase (acetyl-transferring) E1 component subunit alpha [Jatrophihabitantaceae bacterium]
MTDPHAGVAATAVRQPEPPQIWRDYYQQMSLIRAFELRAAEMYQRAKIGGYCHLNVGEEATVVGLMAALAPRDYLFTTYREHGYALARGMEAGRVMAELFGKSTGVSGGRGGSMHLFDQRLRMLGGYGIVGGQIPPATGAALALTYRGEPGPNAEAVMCLLGDGTTNIGSFHESLNLAALWHLPIVYVIVNNGLGMATTVEHASAEPDLYKRGCSYRMDGVRVDGNDVIAVRDAAREALTRARVEHKPTILEAVSQRLRGHSVVDPARYRTAAETERLRSHDPVHMVRARLIDDGVLDEDSARRIDESAEAQVNAAVAFAEESPDPDVATLFEYAYATPVPNTPHRLPADPVIAGGMAGS